QRGPGLSVREAGDGTLWMAELTRSVRPVPLPETLGQMPDAPEIQVGSAAILFDKDGALWIASQGDGLRRAPAPERVRGKIGEFSDAVESFTAKNGLTEDTDYAIFEDREGSIWVGTHDGLDRFRKGKLVPVALPVTNSAATLVAGDEGEVWAVEHAPG